MLAETIVTQRIVYEAVQKAGGPVKVSITLELMNMVKNSYKTYAQEEKKRQQSDAQKRVVQKRKATVDLSNAVANKEISSSCGRA